MSTKGKAKAFKPFLSKAEQEELARKAKLRRKAKTKAAAEQLAQDLREAAEQDTRERALVHWNHCLDTLQEGTPKYATDPWLFITHSTFTHSYLQCLDEVLSSFRDHASEFSRIKQILTPVYDIFVLIASFAKTQPCFYITDPCTLAYCVKILAHVAHKGGEKSIYPNLIHMLLPTFKREHLLPLLHDLPITTPLLKWVGEWMPFDACLVVICQSIQALAVSPVLKEKLFNEPNFERLQIMAMGVIEGLTPEQQSMVMVALRAFPTPIIEQEQDDEDEDDDDENGGGSGGVAINVDGNNGQ